jgi:RimJ/RimL family protein N-acetyltransferase
MIHLVPVSISDQELMTKWFEDDIEGQKELSSYTDLASWLKLLTPESRYAWIVYEDDNAIGFTDLEKGSFGVGYFSFYISPDKRGKGKGKQLLLTLIEKAKSMQFKQLEAGAEEKNIASQKALTSVGFALNGKDKDDYLLYKLSL